MKLQTKFLSLSAISLICALILAYTVYYGVTRTSNFPNTAEQLQNSIHNQSYRAATSYAIQGEIWRALYQYNLGNKDVAKESIAIIQEYLKDYRDNNINEDSLDLPATVHHEIQLANNYFDDAINKAQTFVISLDAPDLSKKLDVLNALFEKENQINDIVYYQLLDQLTLIRHELKIIVGNMLRAALVISIVIILLIFLIPVFLHYNFFAPLAKIINVMHLVEQNGWKEDMPFTERSDEIGDIANALEVFRFHNLEKIELEASTKKHEIEIQHERHEEMLLLAGNFERSIKGIADTVASAATKMDETAKDLAKHADNVKLEAEQIAITSAKTNDDIQAVSIATEDCSQAADRIALQASNSREYAKKASTQTDNISIVVNDLEEKAKLISGVLDIIGNIASQIELLSLNAAIEAARAGEAGKGFAVVAEEVKALAVQTSSATGQVSKKIEEIQSSTDKAINAIKEITNSVVTISGSSVSIASAAEEQNEATSDIAARLSSVALMSKEFNTGIEAVSKSTSHSGESAAQMVTAAANLAKQSTMLQNEVDKFLSNLKNS